MLRKILPVFFPIFLLLETTWVFAASYDIKQMTPQVQQALNGRQRRYEELQILKASGLIGENNQGYAEALKNQSNAGQLAGQENEDRKVIYHAIVAQNNLGPSGLWEVQRAFAEVQRDKARPGDFVQSASGEWAQK